MDNTINTDNGSIDIYKHQERVYITVEENYRDSYGHSISLDKSEALELYRSLKGMVENEV